jgi:hypothetical protein
MRCILNIRPLVLDGARLRLAGKNWKECSTQHQRLSLGLTNGWIYLGMERIIRCSIRPGLVVTGLLDRRHSEGPLL